MILGEMVVLLSIVVLSILFLIESHDYPKLAGNLPRLILSILIGVSVIRGFMLLKKNQYSFKSEKKVQPTKKFFKALALTFSSVILIKLIGFYLSLGLLVFIYPGLFGLKSIRPRIITAAVVIIFIYVVFNLLLKTNFPAGLIGI